MSFGSNPFPWSPPSSHGRHTSRPQRNSANLGIMARTGDRGISITGDKEVDAILKALPEVLRDEYMKKACQAAINYIVKPAVLANIPQGKTGNLRAGLRVHNRRRRPGEDIVGYKLQMRRPAYHAYIIEFGTKDRVTKQGHERGRVPGRKFAFMRPGLYNNEAKIRRAFKIAVREFIRKGSTKAKYAKRAIEYLEGSP
jgi:hypothetical protein